VEGFALGSEYRWYRNRSGVVTLVSVLNDHTTVPSYETEKDDQWWVQVRPRDLYGVFGSAVNSSPITIGNSLPFIRIFNWLTTNPTKSDDIRFSFEYFDWDNDPMNETQTLILIQIDKTTGGLIFKNGTISTIISAFDKGSNRYYYIITVLLTHGDYQKNDNVSVVIRPFDGTNWAGTNYTSAILPIVNTPPECINANLYPTVYNGDEVLYLNWTFFDDDGDNEDPLWDIYWLRNGMNTSYDERYIPLLAVNDGDRWEARVRVHDGTEYSSDWIITFIDAKVVNIDFHFNDPMISQVNNPRLNEFYVEDENLNISYQFSSEGDALGSWLQWFRLENDSWVEYSEFENQTTIDSQYTQSGDLWNCTITPYDNANGFTWARRSISIMIESRPRILTSVEELISEETDVEGHYTFEIDVSDSLHDIDKVTFVINTDEYLARRTSPGKYTLDYQIDTDLFPDYLNTDIPAEVTVTCVVTYASTQFEIYQILPFNFTIKDNVAPRVTDARVDFDKTVLNPINITFYAEVKEFGLGIEEVSVYYYFITATETNISEAGIGSSLAQTEYHVLMQFKNASEDDKYYYSVTIPFKANSTSWKVIYRISTTDLSGNTNPSAFDVQRDDPDSIESNIIPYTPPGLPEWVLLVAALAVFISFIGAVVYVKFIRKPELVGLDKDLVLENISKITEDEVSVVLDSHTIGVVVSFFDQRHGPIPIIMFPIILRDNFNKLVDLSDRSFSGTGFSEDFVSEIPSSYDFVLTQGLRTSVMSFGYALERPESRGGQENLTLNILIHKGLFKLVNQFLDEIQEKVHQIHLLMDKSSEEKEQISAAVSGIRKFVSRIILSYEALYGTTELVEKE
jgi:hypothetical protein